MRIQSLTLADVFGRLPGDDGGPRPACPNCKEAVSAQPAEVANMAQGYNWSIMLMLGVPLSLAGTGAFMVRRAVKRGIFPEI